VTAWQAGHLAHAEGHPPRVQDLQVIPPTPTPHDAHRYMTPITALLTSTACSSHLACTRTASIRKKEALKRSSTQRYPSPASSAAKTAAAQFHFLQAAAQDADAEGAGRAAESAPAAAAALTPLAKQALQVHSGRQTVSFFEWLELLLRRVLKPIFRSINPRCVACALQRPANVGNRRVADAAGHAAGCAHPCANASSKSVQPFL
jgi:hypothetical protein